MVRMSTPANPGGSRGRTRRTRLAHVLFYYGPLAAWIALSLLFATALGGYNHTVSVIYGVLAFAAPETASPDVNHLYGVTHVVRRGAYVLEYGVLALLLVRAIQGGEPRIKRHALFAVAGFGVLFALLDNGVRVASPGRHGGWDDLALSLANVAVVTGFTRLFFAVKAWERDHFGSSDSGSGDDPGSEAVQ